MGPEVLRDLTFAIEANSFQFLTGPSGAGKTTLLRLILMAVRPTRGLLSLFGRDVVGIAGDTLTGVRRRLLRLFIGLNRVGTSVGIATHDFSLMDQLDVRRLVLADGHLHLDE